jgi:hypothetical protein
MLDDYPCEDFEDVCLIKFAHIDGARLRLFFTQSWPYQHRPAKLHLDDRAFYGGSLRVNYAPKVYTLQYPSIHEGII